MEQTQRLLQLEQLVEAFYDAAELGFSMDDPTDDELQDYEALMRELMQRAEVLMPHLKGGKQD